MNSTHSVTVFCSVFSISADQLCMIHVEAVNLKLIVLQCLEKLPAFTKPVGPLPCSPEPTA